MRVTLEILEDISVIAVEARRSAYPYISPHVLDDAVDLTAGEASRGVQYLKVIHCSEGGRYQQNGEDKQ